MFKKSVVLFLALILFVSVFNGCNNEKPVNVKAETTTVNETSTKAEETSLNETTTVSETEETTTLPITETTEAITVSVNNKVETTSLVTESKTTKPTVEKTTEKKEEQVSSMSLEAETSLKRLRNKMSKKQTGNNNFAAVSFLGYVNSKNSKKQIKSFINGLTASDVYPFLKEIKKSSYVSTGGAELYAIVPKNNKTSITIYRAFVNDNGEYMEEKTPLYDGKAGETIILCCNISEIYSDAFVSVKNSKNTKTFRPSISMENGQLIKNKGFFDFSCYDNPEAKSDIDVAMGYSSLKEVKEIKDYLKKGYSLVYTERIIKVNDLDCMLYSIGTYSNDTLIPEKNFAVCDADIYTFEGEEGWIKIEF